MNMLSLQEGGVTAASFNGHGASGSTSVFGMPLGLFVLLLVVVDVVIALCNYCGCNNEVAAHISSERREGSVVRD